MHAEAIPNLIAVTKSDSTTYDPPLVGLRVGTAGDVKVTSNGNDITITGVLAGETITGNISKVFSAGTDAGALTGMEWPEA